jgi:hypothetical protein
MRRFCLGFVLTVAVLFPNIGNAQVNSESVIVGGLTYYPTRAFRMFDGQVMAQTGMYANAPVYSDTTLEPYSELYVPVGNGRMRVYERRRERELAGTTGTAGSFVPRVASESAVLPDLGRPHRTSIITAVSHTNVANGVWLEFNGARWYSNGPANVFSPDRFEPIGEYHGFPVYRNKTSGTDDIWVSVVKDGPVAPYAKR